MSAHDTFHDAVKHGLEKDGWMVTHDPFKVKYEGLEMFIDLRAEKLLAAEKEGQSIAVEIKSFLGASAIFDFHTALGQFINYRVALRKQDPKRVLYLAVPRDTYSGFFSQPFLKIIVSEMELKLIVYDPVAEAIDQWIK